jgi:hypothetical protein
MDIDRRKLEKLFSGGLYHFCAWFLIFFVHSIISMAIDPGEGTLKMKADYAQCHALFTLQLSRISILYGAFCWSMPASAFCIHIFTPAMNKLNQKRTVWKTALIGFLSYSFTYLLLATIINYIIVG